MLASELFDEELIRRYDKAGPRYTSYPTAVQFTDQFSTDQYKAEAWDSNTDLIPRPLSLYFHIPFCDTVCFYCGCNKVVTKDHSRAAPYLQQLFHEMEMQARLFETDRMVKQLHWGGGTPTFLSDEEMFNLMNKTRQEFSLVGDAQGEYSIELDPRDMDHQRLVNLREIGFNRISLGVQDFDPQVQKAVNRIQGEDETLQLIRDARDMGFRSINVDLIYGLPHQSVDSFDKTLERITEVRPDRLSIFNYAHLPERFKPQRRINVVDLPNPSTKLKIFQHTVEHLLDAGYVYIGMDHFALPDDELAVAQHEGTLTRNFQGYATGGAIDIIGMGVSAIGKIGDCYAQNTPRLEPYEQALKEKSLPIVRGRLLNDDDILRRAVINEIICHFRLDLDEMSQQFGIDISDYFGNELDALTPLLEDRLLERDGQRFTVLPRGRLLVRHICMAFDAYMNPQSDTQRYSRII